MSKLSKSVYTGNYPLVRCLKSMVFSLPPTSTRTLFFEIFTLQKEIVPELVSMQYSWSPQKTFFKKGQPKYPVVG